MVPPVNVQLPGDERSGEMKRLTLRLRSLLVDEDGPTATEYAVMLALIIVVAIAAITTLGQNVDATFDSVNTQAFGS
jgi:pilus assembly protein Flp/PilA